MIRLSPWQRLIAILATVLLSLQALTDYLDQDRIGASFVVASLFGLVALTPPASEVPWLPNPLHFIMRWKLQFLAVVALIAIAGVGALYIRQRNAEEAYRQAQSLRAEHQRAQKEMEAIKRDRYEKCVKDGSTKQGSSWDYYNELRCKDEADRFDPVIEAISSMRKKD